MRLWSHRIRGPDRPITTNLLGATCKGRAYSRGESNNTTFHTHIWGRRWAAAGPEELAITRAPLRAVAPHRKAGGPGWEDGCARAFNTVLEDIEHSEYYRLHGAPPGKGGGSQHPVGQTTNRRYRQRSKRWQFAHGSQLPRGLPKRRVAIYGPRDRFKRRASFGDCRGGFGASRA
jgi:hypothetical protein